MFADFLKEHTILTTVNNSADDIDDVDDEDLMLEPTAEGKQLVRRTTCYPPHLQRIKNRDPINNSHQKTYLVEVPLSELVIWDAVRGLELAQRATKNATRYHELFCKVIDSVLSKMEVTTGGGRRRVGAASSARDSIDVLMEQRQAQQEARQAEVQNNANNLVDDVNGPLGGGGLENDAAVLGAGNGTGGTATEELPALLMRRYELRVLPLRRPGAYPPFDVQFRDNDSTQYTSSGSSAIQAVSLRQIRSRAMGHLVTVSGMIVRASDVKPTIYKYHFSFARGDCS